jgi:tetratricopeptide (TPR) repeat protein/TolB-like protein
VRALGFVVIMFAVSVGAASAQLAAPQAPTSRLLVLPFSAAAADSAASIQLADGVRDRLTQLVKNKVMVVPKAKLCEALKASGFPCDIMLDDQQARQLARFLDVHAYLTGTFQKNGESLVANVRLIDIKSSGMAASFTATNGNPGTAVALADEIAQRVASVIRTSEHVRTCNEERQKSQFARARASANRALAVDPNSTGAHLCMATVYEAQRLPDSVLAASKRALVGDSLNGTAWENIARILQQKGDTLGALNAFIAQLRGEPRNTQKRLAIASLLRQMKQYQRAVEVIDDGLKITSGDPQLLELKTTICIEGSLWRCSVEGMMAKAQHDSSVLSDTTFLKGAIGAAQQLPDSDAAFKSQALLTFTRAAVQRFPSNVSFVRANAAGYELAGKPDSAQLQYRKALSLDPNDISTSLQIAKAIIDRAVYDTTAARLARERKDSVGLRTMQEQFAMRVDSARPFLRPGLLSSDSTQKLAAAVIMLTGGSKLAQAAAYDRAYLWLDTLLQVVPARSASDTVGPKYQIRLNGSFWYGLSSVLTLNRPYQEMTKAKGPTRCAEARAVFDRLARTKSALQFGRRVHPPTADQMLGFVAQYEKAKPSVQRAFKCSPALN